MASPQKENGYVGIANELFDTILKFKCTGLQKELIFSIIRFTYGFNRKEAPLSLRFLAQYLDRPYNKVSKTLNELIEMNIIQVKQDYNKQHVSRVLEFNKNYEGWKGKAVTKIVTVVQLPKRELISDQNSNSNSYQNGNKEIQPINTNIKTGKIKNEKKGFKEIVIPAELLSIQGFKEVFEEWCRYRQEIKKPLTPTAINIQFKDLKGFHNEGYDIISIIYTSITNHWQGLFKPKFKPASSPNTINAPQPFLSESDRMML